jgi:hypothetical protein
MDLHNVECSTPFIAMSGLLIAGLPSAAHRVFAVPRAQQTAAIRAPEQIWHQYQSNQTMPDCAIEEKKNCADLRRSRERVADRAFARLSRYPFGPVARLRPQLERHPQGKAP